MTRGVLQDNEVREFTGWIQGRPEDYIMSLVQHQNQQHLRRKIVPNIVESATSQAHSAVAPRRLLRALRAHEEPIGDP